MLNAPALISKDGGFAYLTTSGRSPSLVHQPVFIDVGLEAVLAATNSLVRGNDSPYESTYSSNYNFEVTRRSESRQTLAKARAEAPLKMSKSTDFMITDNKQFESAVGFAPTKSNDSFAMQFSRDRQPTILSPIQNIVNSSNEPPSQIGQTAYAGYKIPRFSAFTDFAKKMLSDVETRRRILSSPEFKEVNYIFCSYPVGC